MVAAIRTRYSRELARLQRTALGFEGTVQGWRLKKGHRVPPQILVSSTCDPSVQVALFASNSVIGPDDPDTTELTGHYPPGSKMVFVSVTFKNMTTRSAVDNETEADAWGLALVPDGFEDYSLSVGKTVGTVSGARHYRHVLGPDGHVCAIDEQDRAVLAHGYTG